MFVLNAPLRLLAFLIAVAPLLSAPPAQGLVVTPASVMAGGEVEAQGQGFREGYCFKAIVKDEIQNSGDPAPVVTIRWDGSNGNAILKTFPLEDRGGAFSQSFPVPDVPPGQYKVKAECPNPYSSGSPGAFATAPLEVLATPPPPPPPPPALTITPTSVGAGGAVTAQGGDFRSCLPVEGPRRNVRFHFVDDPGSDVIPDPNDPRVFGKATLNDAGTIESTSLTVPPNASSGTHNVAAECGEPNGPGDGEILYETLEVLPVLPPPPPPPSSSVGPPPSSGGGSGGESGGSGGSGSGSGSGSELIPSSTPGGGTLPPTTGSGGLGVVVTLAIVAALVALAALGRRLLRARPPPQHTARLPVVAARVLPDPVSLVELRRAGPGRTIAIRVVAREDPGERVVQRVGGGRPG